MSNTQDKERNTRKQLQDEILQLRKNLPAQLVPPRVFVTDITPEALQNHLAEHNERAAVLTDEGNLFEILAGLYSDGKSNPDVYLQGHAGGHLRVERNGRAVHLNRIALTVGLVVQPQVMADLKSGSKRSFRGKSLLTRFLYCLPKSNIGKRDVCKRQSISPSIRAAYISGIKKLLDIKSILDEHGKEIPTYMGVNALALSCPHKRE